MARLSGTKGAPAQNRGSAGLPPGSSAAATCASARPPFTCQAVTGAGCGGPSKNRP